jgi:hypothetical protein
MDTYEVVTGRQGGWWWVEIKGVDMGFTQARRFTEVEPMAREVISMLKGVAADAFTLSVRIEGAEGALSASVQRLREEALAAKLAAAAEEERVAKALTAQGLPVRDVAALLGKSPAWASVLSRRASAAA